MKTLNATSLLTGALAGITAALLLLGATPQSYFAILLVIASALPVLIAGLGWGNAAAAVAVVVAGLGLALFASPLSAFFVVILMLAPAAWLSHLANLARPASEIGGPKDALAWYPLSDILAHLVLLVTVAAIIIGAALGYDDRFASIVVDQVLIAMKAQDPLLNPAPAVVEQIKSLFQVAWPLLFGALWVMILFAAYYIASRIVQTSGKGLRPREDMPSTLRMHRYSIFAFLGGLVLAFMGGTPAIIGALICGTFGAGFLLAGFAVFHFRTRGKSWRLPVLWIGYMSVLIFQVPAFFFLLSGLMDTRRAIALSPAGKTTDTETKDL
ncbi:DUF2232 domain-containing protein [Pararhizobium sp. A13]|uniref:DUF2232 domain-containing protein n=1 Tax=Pararhizobium sp. A13 TaxID=3133975 RepID=UPI0032463C9F